MNLKQKVLKNSLWNLGTSMLARVGSLIFTILLARFLMPEGFGIFSIVFSTAMIFYIFADLGVNGTLIRYVSLAIVKDKKKVSSYHFYLLKVKFVLTAISAAALLVLSYPIAFYFFKNSQLFLPLIVSSFYIFVLAFEGFYTSAFYSIEQVKYTGVKEFLSQTLRIILALFVFYFVAASYQVVGIFLSSALVAVFTLCFSLYYLNKLSPQLFSRKIEKIDKKGVVRFIGYVTIASISAVFFSYIDSIILGLYVSPEYVGYYRAAFSLISGVTALLSFPNLVLLSTFTKLKDFDFERILNKVLQYLFIIIVPSIFGLVILGKYFIRFFYGYAYMPAITPFYFLALLIFPMTLTSLFLSLFTAKEKPEVLAKLVLISSTINIILNFVFIKVFLSFSPLWATVGAALATLLGWFIYFFLTIRSIKKEFGFSVSFNSAIKPVFSSLVMFFALFFILKYIKDMTLVFGAITVLLGVFIYFAAMLILRGINKQDFNLILSLCQK